MYNQYFLAAEFRLTESKGVLARQGQKANQPLLRWNIVRRLTSQDQGHMQGQQNHHTRRAGEPLIFG